VSQNLIEVPQTITVGGIEAERRPELRRVMIERYRDGDPIYGPAAFLLDAGATRLDYDEAFGTLWGRDVAGDEPIVMVEVVNKTPEPDGSYGRYWLRVHPEIAASPGRGRPWGTTNPQRSECRRVDFWTLGIRVPVKRRDVEQRRFQLNWGPNFCAQSVVGSSEKCCSQSRSRRLGSVLRWPP
jgi:hypothetical protein